MAVDAISRNRERLPSARTGLVILLAATILSGLAGCSSNDKKSPAGVTAGRLCDSSLDAKAAASLDHVSGVSTYDELPGKNDFGEPNKFSLARAAAHIGTTLSQRTKCTVYRASDDSGYPLLDITFSRTSRYPKKSNLPLYERSYRMFYPIGLYADTGKQNSASLYFSCPAKQKDVPSYVMARMYITSNQRPVSDPSKDRMTVLNSVARGMAKALGCSSESGLPVNVPSGTQS
ncbi:hypothetical protein R6V09_19255 [Streptomyces sp. W16]|uniref:hypothetical protein n=1 Tax=Streptomyces sp. W16 TaxID=3076631 RepID=UPI00295BE025|nr:hypothetical protein [Streptomyces sp. W16]MDV9172237.1 hypothetical protein [Streptomyces sp. W16]